MQKHSDSIDAAVDALFAGDDQGAKLQLRAAVGEVQRAHVGAAAQEFERRHEVSAARREFERNHPELAADPVARNIADQFLIADLRQRGFTDLDAVPIAAIGDFIDRAGDAAERHLGQGSAIADGPEAGRSAIIERMRAARHGA